MCTDSFNITLIWSACGPGLDLNQRVEGKFQVSEFRAELVSTIHYCLVAEIKTVLRIRKRVPISQGFGSGWLFQNPDQTYEKTPRPGSYHT